MDRKPYSRERYPGTSLRHMSRPSATLSKRDHHYSSFKNSESNRHRSSKSHHNEFETFADSYNTNRFRGNTESLNHFYEMDRPLKRTHQSNGSNIRDHSSSAFYRYEHDLDNGQRTSREKESSCHNVKEIDFQRAGTSEKDTCVPPPPPAWPVDEVELPRTINLGGENNNNSDSDEKLNISPKLGKKQRRRLNMQTKLLLNSDVDNAKRLEVLNSLKKQEQDKAVQRNARRKENKLQKRCSFNIIDINVTGGRFPQNKHSLFLSEWNNVLQNADRTDGDPKNFIACSNFSDGVFMIRLVNVDFLPLLEKLVDSLPALWPDAMFRLIPLETKRATMLFPKGTMSKSNADILRILAEENPICTKQWVIGFRTSLEFKDFYILGIDRSAEEYLSQIGCYLNFLKRSVSVRVSGKDCQYIYGPTKKELKKVIQQVKRGEKLTKKVRKSITAALNNCSSE